MTEQIIVLALVTVVAIVVVVGSIKYKIAMIHEEEAEWDALIERVRRGKP
jgi:hypothetical protein